jgi:hypothetical protein
VGLERFSQSQIIAASELTVSAEELRIRVLADPTTGKINQLIRLQRIADAAVRALGVESVTREDTKPGLAEYLGATAEEVASRISAPKGASIGSCTPKASPHVSEWCPISRRAGHRCH